MKRLLAALCALSMLILSGCSFNVLESTDDLYSLPKASEEYTSLQESLQSLLDSGLEYAPPLSGSNTQPVQLQDLDGDGEQE
ncbi:MAG: VCBS repeat-containing protein, partial [Clostridiales bacterium]|nr:VCBS repeat-containing protein [Clostridiales bacterium]